VSIATFIPPAKVATKVNTDIRPTRGLPLDPVMAGANETNPTTNGPMSANSKEEITDRSA
jgi:hypothetical protein